MVIGDVRAAIVPVRAAGSGRRDTTLGTRHNMGDVSEKSEGKVAGFSDGFEQGV